MDAAGLAAARGDPGAYLSNLKRSGSLGGLKRRMLDRWGNRISEDEVDDAIGQATDQLYHALRSGCKVTRKLPYLLKIVDCNLFKYNDIQKNKEFYDPDNPEHSNVLEFPDEVTGKDAGDRPVDICPERFLIAIRVARSLLPQVKISNAQVVWTYILEVMEQGGVDLPNHQIADAVGLSVPAVKNAKQRGWASLRRLAQETGLWEESFDYEALRQRLDDEDYTDEPRHEDSGSRGK